MKKTLSLLLTLLLAFALSVGAMAAPGDVLDVDTPDATVEASGEIVNVKANNVTVTGSPASITIAEDVESVTLTDVVTDSIVISGATVVEITGECTVASLEIAESAVGANVTVGADVKVEMLAAAAPEAKLEISGSVATVAVAETAIGVAIATTETATIEIAIIAAEGGSLTGEGTVAAVTAVEGVEIAEALGAEVTTATAEEAAAAVTEAVETAETPAEAPAETPATAPAADYVDYSDDSDPAPSLPGTIETEEREDGATKVTYTAEDGYQVVALDYGFGRVDVLIAGKLTTEDTEDEAYQTMTGFTVQAPKEVLGFADEDGKATKQDAEIQSYVYYVIQWVSKTIEDNSGAERVVDSEVIKNVGWGNVDEETQTADILIGLGGLETYTAAVPSEQEGGEEKTVTGFAAVDVVIEWFEEKIDVVLEGIKEFLDQHDPENGDAIPADVAGPIEEPERPENGDEFGHRKPLEHYQVIILNDDEIKELEEIAAQFEGIEPVEGPGSTNPDPEGDAPEGYGETVDYISALDSVIEVGIVPSASEEQDADAEETETSEETSGNGIPALLGDYYYAHISRPDDAPAPSEGDVTSEENVTVEEGETTTETGGTVDGDGNTEVNNPATEPPASETPDENEAGSGT